MSNEIATVERPEFAVERVTTRKTKTGTKTAVVIRGLLRTIVSGKTEERKDAAMEYGLQLWERHQYGALVGDFAAVFPSIKKTAESVNEARLADDPGADIIRVEGPYRKSDALKLMGFACKSVGADKGEKAKFCAIARRIAAYELELREKLAAEQQAAITA